MRRAVKRLTGLVIATMLGWMLFGWGRSARTDYWVLADGQQGTATLVKEHWSGHNKVVYNYVVNQNQYTGVSRRDWRSKSSGKAKPGEQAIVYFSASHPWLSRLYKPDHFLGGWPVLVIVLPLGILALITLIKPTSKWAFDLDDNKADTETKTP